MASKEIKMEIDNNLEEGQINLKDEAEEQIEFINCDSIKREVADEIETAGTYEKYPMQFACDEELCDKTYATEQRLNTHKLLHSRNNFCTLCSKSFSNRNNFVQHVNKHMLEGALECQYCNKTFSSKHKYGIHLRVHTNERPYKCDQCGKMFKQKSAKNKHQNTHSKAKRYACEICGKDFSAAYSLKQHVLFLHKNLKSFNCNLCPRIFPSTRALTEHKKYHEFQEPPKNKLAELQTLVKHSLGEGTHNGFRCETCLIDFEEDFVRQVHMEIHEDQRVQCSLCEKFFHQTTLQSHMDKIHQKDHCTACNQDFYDKIEFRKHQKYHQGYEHCICAHCRRRFAYKASLITHLKKRHATDTKIFKCELCDKTFSTPYQLNVHSITHKTDRQFKCKLCNGAFKRKRHLINHMVTHAKSSPFSCDLCNKTFKTSLRLTAHKIVHSNEKPFKCTLCPLAFKKASYLKFHLNETHKTEKDILCELCNKRFKRVSSLQYHMVHAHNPIKQHEKQRKKLEKLEKHKCSTCRKQFPNPSTLAHHMVSHSNKRPFKCDDCGQSYKTQDTLNRHIQRFCKKKKIKCEICKISFDNVDVFKKHHCIQNMKSDRADSVDVKEEIVEPQGEVKNEIFIKSEFDAS